MSDKTDNIKDRMKEQYKEMEQFKCYSEEELQQCVDSIEKLILVALKIKSYLHHDGSKQNQSPTE